MRTIGESLRELRETNNLLLRQVAAILEVDPSLLSKIERGEKRPTREQIIMLANIYDTPEDNLMIQYLSDRVVYELKNEDLALEVMKLAEQKISFLVKEKRKRKVEEILKKPSTIKNDSSIKVTNCSQPEE